MDIRQWPKDFTLAFINEYRSHSCLWKMKSSEYSDRNMKSAAYDELITMLHEVDPSATKETVVKKIDSLRSNFRKELKKVKASKQSGLEPDEIYKPKLWYFKNLQFLMNQDDDVVDDEINVIDASRLKYDDVIEEWMEQDDIGQAGFTISEVDIPLSPESSYTSDSQPCSATRSKVKKQPCRHWCKKFNRSATKLPDDEFGIIGQNVAFKLRRLPRDVRIMSEKFINDVLFEAEMGNINRNSSMSITLPQSQKSP